MILGRYDSHQHVDPSKSSCPRIILPFFREWALKVGLEPRRVSAGLARLRLKVARRLKANDFPKACFFTPPLHSFPRPIALSDLNALFSNRSPKTTLQSVDAVSSRREDPASPPPPPSSAAAQEPQGQTSAKSASPYATRSPMDGHPRPSYPIGRWTPGFRLHGRVPLGQSIAAINPVTMPRVHDGQLTPSNLSDWMQKYVDQAMAGRLCGRESFPIARRRSRPLGAKSAAPPDFDSHPIGSPPTRTKDRQKTPSRTDDGFLYYVSVTGITGGTFSRASDVLRRQCFLVARTNRTAGVHRFRYQQPETAAHRSDRRRTDRSVRPRQADRRSKPVRSAEDQQRFPPKRPPKSVGDFSAAKLRRSHRREH